MPSEVNVEALPDDEGFLGQPEAIQAMEPFLDHAAETPSPESNIQEAVAAQVAEPDRAPLDPSASDERHTSVDGNVSANTADDSVM